jgi:hypothetical protein
MDSIRNIKHNLLFFIFSFSLLLFEEYCPRVQVMDLEQHWGVIFFKKVGCLLYWEKTRVIGGK